MRYHPWSNRSRTGEYDLAIGSRLKKGANVIGRTLKREVVSRCYNLIVRSMFFVRFRDAQCGFKAIKRDAARELAPLVLDNGWFFDTELLILAEKNGYRIYELPVTWTDDPDTRVKIVKTAYDDMMGLFRLRLRRSEEGVGTAEGRTICVTGGAGFKPAPPGACYSIANPARTVRVRSSDPPLIPVAGAAGAAAMAKALLSASGCTIGESLTSVT